MSLAADRRPATTPPAASVSAGVTSRTSPWIHGRWPDLALFIGTPLLIVPLIGLIRWRYSIEQVALYVTAFGAMGHHLPGMLRAYGDRELFRRFRARFLLAPVLLLGVALVFSLYELDGLVLVAVLWATWHAWMQVYGFLRIYDSKRGCVDARTARIDLAMCAGWFVSGVLFSPTRLGQLLSDFYKCGGPQLSRELVHGAQWTCGGLTALATVAFIGNAWSRWHAGRPPSPIKLVLLVSSIGFWWYAMIVVNNAILGVALFEVFHDVQYLAIVWQFNRRRAAAGQTAGAFTRFLFRGGGVMLGLYLGLVFSYGALGLLPRVIDVDVVNRVLAAVFVTSGLLHFYYDGFIWKVREKATREGLGLQAASEHETWNLPGGVRHALKWAPFCLVVGWFGWSQAHGVAPPAQRLEQVVAAVPDAWQTQLELGVEYLRQDDPKRAIGPLTAAVEHAPQHADANYRLGNALAKVGRDEDALQYLERATETDPLLVDAHVDCGALLARRNLPRSAEEHLRRALALDPTHVKAQHNLGTLLLKRGALDEAAPLLEQAAAADPPDVEALINLGVLRMRQQRLDEATNLFQSAMDLEPDHMQARLNLGAVLAQQGDFDRANAEYRVVLKQEPDSVAALNSLAWNLATGGDSQRAGEESVELAERAAELTSRRDLSVLQTLAAAYAAAGRFNDAVATAEHVEREARRLNDASILQQLTGQLQGYRRGRPVHTNLPNDGPRE